MLPNGTRITCLLRNIRQLRLTWIFSDGQLQLFSWVHTLSVKGLSGLMFPWLKQLQIFQPLNQILHCKSFSQPTSCNLLRFYIGNLFSYFLTYEKQFLAKTWGMST